MIPPSLADKEPDIRVAGLSMWLVGRGPMDWLEFFAACSKRRPMAAVSTRFRRWQVAAFRDECQSLYDRLEGAAIVGTSEHELRLEFVADSGGRITLTVEVTPDVLRPPEGFFYRIDQTYLPPILEGCASVLDEAD
jgi:hypothetical protein